MEKYDYLSPVNAGYVHSRLARVVGSILAAAADCCAPAVAMHLSSKRAVSEVDFITLVRKHALLWSILGHWAMFTAPRALANSWEASLTAIAVAYIFRVQDGVATARIGGGVAWNPTNFGGWGCAALAATLRASSLPFWAVIFCARALMIKDKGHTNAQFGMSIKTFLPGVGKWALKSVSPGISFAVVSSIVLDACWHGCNSIGIMGIRVPVPKWSLGSWLQFNWSQRASAAQLFGSHSWHWYDQLNVFEGVKCCYADSNFSSCAGMPQLVYGP